MALRSVWKGFIKFSLLTIPVKMFKAVDDSEEIHFNELHRECGGRVGRENKCKKCGGVPVREEIVKGYEVGPDEYVQVEKAELDAIKLVSTKMLVPRQFMLLPILPPSLLPSQFRVMGGEIPTGVFCKLIPARSAPAPISAVML